MILSEQHFAAETAVEQVFHSCNLPTHQAVDQSHAQSVGSLVQFHYKHHTQVIRKGRCARGGYRERKLTPTNTPCRGDGHPNPQKHAHTQTNTGSRYGVGLLCREDTQILKGMQRHSYAQTCFSQGPVDVTLTTL